MTLLGVKVGNKTKVTPMDKDAHAKEGEALVLNIPEARENSCAVRDVDPILEERKLREKGNLVKLVGIDNSYLSNLLELCDLRRLLEIEIPSLV